MDTININNVVIDNQVLDALKDYQEDGAKIDAQTLDTTIDYLFESSEALGYANNMDGDNMLKLIYKLRKMKDCLLRLLPEKETGGQS
ncbi:hypothetical protein [Bacteroides sp. UBA939]|uniref:hypothetical protein n=1 Tax=Bacteroides sp. UBA939 TaxID=1946092 RepID=UPI0025C1AE67|nr:hypothetical protein [Bacteroides sp. UBA939]